MTAKEFVLSKYPKAEIIREKGYGRYGLVSYRLKNFQFHVEEKTERKAWSKAKKLIIEYTKK